MPSRDLVAEAPALRDDVEVVVVANRFLLCVGNTTHELTGPVAKDLARVLDALAAGHSPKEAATELGLAESGVNQHVRELAKRGCFLMDERAPAMDAATAIKGHVGIVGVDATSLAVARFLRKDECRISLADWRAWTKLDAAAVPGTKRFVGKPRLGVAKALAGGDQVGAVRLAALSPWDDSFATWLKDKSLVVLSTGYLSPASHEAVNTYCGERGTPWMGIRHGRGFTEIGPPVRPPWTPCYACLALRALLNRTAWNQKVTAGFPPQPRIPLAGAERAEVTGALAVGELRNLASANNEGPLTHVLRIDWAYGEVARLPVLKLPNCPGCGWWSVGSLP